MASFVTDNYKLDITPQGNYPVVYMSQFENGRQIQFRILNRGESYTIPSGISAFVSGLKSNGGYYEHVCTINGSRKYVVMPVESDMTDINGRGVANIVFTNSSGEKVISAKFITHTQQTISDNGIEIPTEAETVFQQLLNEIRSSVTEINADIDGLQATLQAGIANVTASTNNAISVLNSRMDLALQQLNEHEVQTILFDDTTNPLAYIDDTATLEADPTTFDYIDFYYKTHVNASGQGNWDKVFRFEPNSLFPTIVSVQPSDASATNKTLYVHELSFNLSGTTITVLRSRRWYWDGASNTGANLQQSNASSGTAPDNMYGGRVYKIVGVNISDIDELTDLRIGADGTVYQSAGTAIRTQFANITDVYKLSVPGSSAVLSGNLTSGDFAKAYSAFTSGKGVYAVKDGEVYQLVDASSSVMSYCNIYIGSMKAIKKITTYSNDTFEMSVNFISGSFVSYDNTNSGLSATTVQEAIDENTEELGNLNGRLTNLSNTVMYENVTPILRHTIPTTAGTALKLENTQFSVSIQSGTTYRISFNGTGLINKYALYYNNTRIATNRVPNTVYEYTASEDITSFYIYVGASDVIGTGELSVVIDGLTQNEESIEKSIQNLQAFEVSLEPFTGNVWPFDKSTMTEVCIHHDNFSRAMTGWEIGMNAGGTDTGNSYDWVTPSSYDDGLTVDNGATFNADTTRTYNFSLRKLAEAHAENFMFESNAPATGSPVVFGMNVTDIGNFLFLEFRKNSAGYRCLGNIVKNGSFSGNIFDVQLNNIIAKMLSVYCIRGIMYVYFDDTFGFSTEIGDFGDYLYLCSLKSYDTHFDFINLFNLVDKTSLNPNYVLDTGVSNIPLKTVSAGTGNYELQDDVTRWSNYADHFTLHNTDELIHNGRRAEISLSNMPGFAGNLRHFKVSFDVLFPEEYIDTEQGDLFIQTHDRDGTYRGTVPFALYIKGNVLNINTSSTYEPKADNTTVIIDLRRFDFAEVELGKWHHFDIEIKERYEERQNPFLRIKIDGNTAFEYRKANCYNDLLGTSPQYGIYKNNWGAGVTEFQRYFDNFKIEYV